MAQRTQLAYSLAMVSELDPATGLPGSELQLAGPTTFAAAVLDFGLLAVPTRIKTIAVVVDSALTSAVAGQATARLYAARSIFATPGNTDPAPGQAPVMASAPFAGGFGAVSQFPTTGLNATQPRGTAVNLGPNTASLGGAGAVFFLSPIDIPELQWYYPVIGIEIAAAVAFTGGSARVFVELASV